MASDLAALYRAERRQHSGSMIYVDAPAPVQKPSIYAQAEPRTLSDYASQPARSQFEQRPGESDDAYANHRLNGLLQHLAETLPPDELAAVADSFNAAVRRLEGSAQTHADLRKQLDARQSGTGRGIIPGGPADRATDLGGRWGGRQVEANGHVTVASISDNPTMSSIAAHAIARQRAAEQRGQQPQHSDLSGLRSSGSGFIGVDNRG
jgi:hypothetical protein